jgi:hypothetical protein
MISFFTYYPFFCWIHSSPRVFLLYGDDGDASMDRSISVHWTHFSYDFQDEIEAVEENEIVNIISLGEEAKKVNLLDDLFENL